VSVGQALTEARAQAGLTVEELSERTRIRSTVIRSIEQDDYEACGGDLYVRGYVRAIAGAVGIDAQPLIREFDQGRGNGAAGRANGSVGRHAMGLSAVATTGTATRFDLPRVPQPMNGTGPGRPDGTADQATTRFDLPAVPEDPAATAFDLPVVPDDLPVVADAALTEQFPSATEELPAAPVPPPAPAQTRLDTPRVVEDLMAAGYDLPQPTEAADEGPATKLIPALDLSPSGPQAPAAPPAREGGGGGKRRRGFLIVAAVIVVIAAGVVVTHLATGKTATTNTAATSVASSAAASSAAAQANASAKAQASASAAAQASASAAAKSSAAAQASQAPSAQPVSTLPVASVAAFGPDGVSDGDSPSTAKDAITANPTQPWATQWYVSPTFGMLKHGTGLLLDLGSKVTVSSVRLDIAQGGGNLQLRAGDGAALQDLSVVATSLNASDTVQLTLSRPVTARYLLVWFTKLAPDGSGHYQESVAHLKVTGRR
jgi:cytoskeletal protein RodZ